jgi:hypothetical protein
MLPHSSWHGRIDKYIYLHKMARWRASVPIGRNAYRQDVEVNANHYNAARDMICHIYRVDSGKISNLHEVREHNSSPNMGDSSSSGVFLALGLFLLAVLIWFLINFAPYLLMGTFGVGSAWGLTKLANLTTDELLEKENRRMYHAILIVCLFSGGTGLVLGDKIKNNYLNNLTEESNPSQAKSSPVQSSSKLSWGGPAAYKFSQVPGGDYPDSCAFSLTTSDGKIITTKSSIEYWACRDVGGNKDAGYKINWVDGKQTTYTFGPDGNGSVVGTNGNSYPMNWHNNSHKGKDITVINHQDGAITWIPGHIQ